MLHVWLIRHRWLGFLTWVIPGTTQCGFDPAPENASVWGSADAAARVIDDLADAGLGGPWLLVPAVLDGVIEVMEG